MNFDRQRGRPYSSRVQRGIVMFGRGLRIDTESVMRALATAPVFFVLAAVLAQEQAIADECLTDWGRAGEIVRHEKLLTVEEIARSLAADGVGQLVKTTLCRSKDGYVYRLVIRQSSGQLKTTVMSAQTPSLSQGRE